MVRAARLKTKVGSVKYESRMLRYKLFEIFHDYRTFVEGSRRIVCVEFQARYQALRGHFKEIPGLLIRIDFV